VSFLQSLNLAKSTLYAIETNNSQNVVVFEFEEISREGLLKTLRYRYENDDLFISEENGNSILVSVELKNVEFNSCPYTEFCIAKFKRGKLHQIILNPDPMMLESEGF
jgi:tRNA U34 5-carboxymethylaminomethyl modifying enzyme MnmG/GidA